MSRKNRPNSPKNQNATPTPAAPAPQPVVYGNVFATFLDEATKIGNEVMARRQTERDVADFLKMKNLIEEFDAWRKAKYTPTPLAQAEAPKPA
jgi:urease alpha subunit